MHCSVCLLEKDTRPYGQGGAAICFGCAMATDESRREAERQFSAQLDACGSAAVVGEQTGPRPVPGTKKVN